jgi:threonine 3-dehydrogenase
MGATRAIDPRQTPLAQTQQELGMHEGFDVGLEMSGSPHALAQMLGSMCHGGKIALLGILPHDTRVDWDLIVFNGLLLKGIYGREMFETWYKMTVLIQCGLDITPLITHHFPYTQFEQAFEVMRSGHSGKVILDWREQTQS